MASCTVLLGRPIARATCSFGTPAARIRTASAHQAGCGFGLRFSGFSSSGSPCCWSLATTDAPLDQPMILAISGMLRRSFRSSTTRRSVGSQWMQLTG